MRLTLVRHGETVGQSSVRYYGRTDVELSDAGRAQMRRVREAVAGERFGAVFTSRLRRSVEAAALIVPGHAVTPVAGFDEVNFGRWEGWTREEIAERDPDEFRRWQERGHAFAYPEGESREIFRARVVAGLDELLAIEASCGGPRPPIAGSDANLLLVLHKGVIAVILSELLRLGAAERARLAIELGSIHVLARDSEDSWRAEALDRIDHLEQAPGQHR